MTKTSVKFAPFWLALGLSLVLAALKLVGVLSVPWWVVILPVLVYFALAALLVVIVVLLIAWTVVAAMFYDNLPPRY